VIYYDFIHLSVLWAMVPCNFQCRGVLLIWTLIEQGPTVHAAGAGWSLLGLFSSHLFYSFCFSGSLH
ncbi:MAG: hypothetical protein AB2693_27445, partial [Candidatus Thiodiazotropha sp.]